MTFETSVCGKWILAGEHAVLRGCPALVFPLRSKILKLAYTKNPAADLQLQLKGPHGAELQLLFFGVVERACTLRNISRASLNGSVEIENSIPIGAGMGASAALCVAVARWFGFLGYLPEEEFYDFAKNLENLFHGESSGVDIAVALSGKALRFLRQGQRTSFSVKWQPHWYISYSGQRGMTSECVTKVKAFIEADPDLGARVDQKMFRSVEMAEKALLSDSKESLHELVSAIQMAKSCFDQWGLTPIEHCQELLDHGAIAVKPTGSGGGGYVLSLWLGPVPDSLSERLIQC